MLRYAILWHSGIDQPHFDLMFETMPGSALSTWRSPVWPIDQVTILERLKDHRREFLDFEGELTGNRGKLQRVAGGNCEIEFGENLVWTIRISTELRWVFRTIDGDRWEAVRAH